MDTHKQVNFYRKFLFLLAAFLFAGTVVELVFQEHTGEAQQLIPFILSGLGIAAVAAVLIWPRRSTLAALRVIMLLAIMGSAIGLFLHLSANLGFAQEIQPNATTTQLITETIHGAAPLLAPGILAVAALLALADTYAHPQSDSKM
jgi:predicted membrane channel-forming protein YqfA (hemolysin III family)